MRYIISWPLSWIFYFAGDLAYWLTERLPGMDSEDPPAAFKFCYFVYQKCMLGSVLTQDWAGGEYGPWQFPEEK